jgi:Mrp family chromosome partitioning ATPase
MDRPPSFLTDRNRAQTEAYDTLARQLVLAGRRRTLKSVIVTSPGAGDGKTTVTLGLARALARLGRRVVIVETDPTTSILVGEPERLEPGGLSGVMSGRSTVAGELVQLDGMIRQELGEKRVGVDAGGTISVLPPGAGELPPHRLLSRAELAGAISASGELADFVLVDGPPTHRLHDALSLVDSVDASLMVCRLRWTKFESVHHGLETLELLGMRVLGVVLTAASGRGTPVRTARKAAVFSLEDVSTAAVGGNGYAGGRLPHSVQWPK